MASTLLRPALTHTPLTRPKPTSKPTLKPTRIHCGPRSNRGPLQKGRILSTQAIQTIQSLKRSQTNPNPTSPITNPHVSLSRLLKSDLIATLHELLRQNQHSLALQVFSTVRTEPWYSPDLTLYADIIIPLARAAMWDDIDRLISSLEDEIDGGDLKLGDKKGLGRLIRGLIGSGKGEFVVRVYKVMKRVGWGVVGSGVEVDEYLAKVLSRALGRFGEMELAKEVDLALERYLNACLGRPTV